MSVNTKIFPFLPYAFILSFIIFFSHITDIFNHNLWSIGYFDCIIKDDELCYLLFTQPESHPRASLWFAREYLSEGYFDTARIITNDLAKQGNADALIIMGQALAAQGDYLAAKNAWTTAGAYQPVMEAARQASEDGRLEDALFAYEAAQIINPNEGTLALVDFLWFPYRDQIYAESVLQKALVEHPASPNIYLWKNRLGKLFRDQERWDEAYNTYSQVLSEKPDDWQASLGFGWVLYGCGDGLDVAKKQFLRVIALNPDQWNGYYAIAEISAREKHFNEADRWFSEAINRAPDLIWLYIARGNYAREGGNISDAIEIYNHANEKFQNEPIVYFEMAWAYKINGDPKEALKSIEYAIVLMETENTWYYTRAGQIYEWLDDLTKAYEAYERALIIDPHNEVARNGYQRIEKYLDGE